jgi:hypothetical protein
LRLIHLWLANKHALTHTDTGVLANESIDANDAFVPVLAIRAPDFSSRTGLAYDFYDFSGRELKLKKRIWIEPCNTSS